MQTVDITLAIKSDFVLPPLISSFSKIQPWSILYISNCNTIVSDVVNYFKGAVKNGHSSINAIPPVSRTLSNDF